MEKEKKKKSKSAKSVSSKKKLGAAAGFNAPSYGAHASPLQRTLQASDHGNRCYVANRNPRDMPGQSLPCCSAVSSSMDSSISARLVDHLAF